MIRKVWDKICFGEFASGNTDVTRQVLEAGARVDHVNSVGRTAAQMAAFVGKLLSVCINKRK